MAALELQLLLRLLSHGVLWCDVLRDEVDDGELGRHLTWRWLFETPVDSVPPTVFKEEAIDVDAIFGTLGDL